MSASADRQLFQLYIELGDAQTQRQRPHEAADAYALALYYARRSGDAFGVQRCRELVLARSPNHVAGQALSAPLFFAQLLMRYPADEAAQTLSELRGGGGVAAPPLPPAAYALDVGPGAPTPLGDLAKPPYPAAEPDGFEAHHVFDLGGPLPAPREDFHLREAGLLDQDAAPARRPLRQSALDVVSYLAIAVGVGGGVFFATQLYPTLRGIDFAGAFRTAPAVDPTVEAAAPEPTPNSEPVEKPKTPDVPPPAPKAAPIEPPPAPEPKLPPAAPPKLPEPPKLAEIPRLEPPKAAAVPPKPIRIPEVAVAPPASKLSDPPRPPLPEPVRLPSSTPIPPVANWDPPKERRSPEDPTAMAPKPPKRIRAATTTNLPGSIRAGKAHEPPPVSAVDDALRLGSRPVPKAPQ